jgi:hypothetical protein
MLSDKSGESFIFTMPLADRDGFKYFTVMPLIVESDEYEEVSDLMSLSPSAL